MKTNLQRVAVLLPVFLAFNITAAVRYVDLNNSNPQPPYTNWTTAARVVQDAVDVAVAGDTVLVTNGTYASGGRAVYGLMTNRVAVDRAITVRSVNGPGATILQGARAPTGTNGDGAIRCVYLTNGALLSGFTLTSGATRIAGDMYREQSGGGVWCEGTNAAISNCVLVGNLAYYRGGGVYGGTLGNCLLLTNQAAVGSRFGEPEGQGGGAYSASLTNCFLAGNAASFGGAAYQSTLLNCTVVSNTAAVAGGGTSDSALRKCGLTNNWGRSGGGVAYGTADACTFSANVGSSSGLGAGAYLAALTNCLLVANNCWDQNGWDQSGRGGGASGGTLKNCQLTGNQAVSGGGADSATLINSILTSNVAVFGGGAYNSRLDHCTMIGNLATTACEGDCGSGGGAAGSVLDHCRLLFNHANNGGGVYRCAVSNSLVAGNSASGGTDSTLYGCTVVSNSGYWGGGTFGGAQYNCIIYFNTATQGSNCYHSSPTYCCVIPDPGGAGNITNEPLFLDPAGGNWRVQSRSPCINAGGSPGVVTTDLDGRPRIVGGTVDMGAYEYQPGTSGWFLGWLEAYGLPTDGSADFADSDGDGMNNWSEFIAHTDPTNSLSALRLLAPTTTTAGWRITWQSVTGVTYFLEFRTNLGPSAPFTPLAADLDGQAGTTSYFDRNTAGRSLLSYRVGIRP
jgi:hypothetical protein